jgi:hypothetical protein
MLVRHLLLLFVILSASVNAQLPARNKNTHRQAVHRIKRPFGERKYTMVGLSVTALNYFGDIAPRPNPFSTDIRFTRPAVEFSLSRKYGPNFKMQTRFLYGVLRGDDKISANPDSREGIYRYRRNASFRNIIEELSLVAIFEHPFNHGFYIHRHLITYYLFAGLGILHHNPQAQAPAHDLNGNPLSEKMGWVDLRPLGTEGQFANLEPGDANFGIRPYRLFQPSIPFGFGVKYKVNATMDLWLELGFRYLFTDYLDDVSRNYVDLGVLDSDLAKSLAYRGNESGEPFNPISYLGRDGALYTVEAGYGSEHPDNMRGSPKENDSFTTFSIRLTRVMNGTMHRPKYR